MPRSKRVNQNQAKNFDDNEDHYRIKSVDPKFNVFNRKLLRKAKRQGVKDLEAYLAEHTKGKKQEKKNKKKENPKKEKQPKEIEEPAPLQNYYDEAADKAYLKRMIEKDEEEIRLYERKLKMTNKDSKGAKRFHKEMVRDGWDEDLFDFLDNISKKVHSETVEDYVKEKRAQKAQKEAKGKKKDKEEDEEIDEEIDSDEVDGLEDEGEGDEVEEGDFDGEEFDEEDEGEFEGEFEEDDGELIEEGEEGDFEDEEGDIVEEGDYEEVGDEEEYIDGEEGEDEGEEEEAEEREKKEKDNKNNATGNKKVKKLNDSHLYGQEVIEHTKKVDRAELVRQHLDPEKKAELEKALRGCVNRVAEGNIDSILNKMIEIYNQNSKYVINELYSEIFMKSCVEQPHVLQMILATNACLIAALYHFLGDDFLADFIRKLIICLRENVDNQPESTNAEESGPGNYKLKNTVLILCYLYDFDVLHDEFLGELVVYLADHLNEESINVIMSIIQNAGFKIRQTSPGSIKLIIEYTRKKYEEYKQTHQEQVGISKKMEIMFLNLNDLKHNKKLANDVQDRLAFLTNWMKKALSQK